MELFFRKEGSGEPLFILHGLFGSSDNWVTLGKKFSEKNTVYLVDQRNHGRSPHSAEWSYESMVDDLVELAKNEGISKAHFLGHSMGGKTIMNLAVSHPEICRSIVVVDISPASYPIHHREILDALLLVDLGSITSRGEAEAILKNKIDDNGTLQFLLKNLYWKEVTGEKKLAWRFNLAAINKNISIVGEPLPFNSSTLTNHLPALFIKGSKSNYIKTIDERVIKQHFPSAEIMAIENAGHWVHAEQPLLFYEMVRRFIDKN